MRAGLSIAAAGAAFLLGFYAGLSDAAPAFVAYRCAGSPGPLYADRRDDLPPCLTIRSTKGD